MQLCIIVMGTAVVAVIADRRSPSRSACVSLNLKVLLLLEQSRHTCKHYVPTSLHIAVLINPLGILRLFITPDFAENLHSCNAGFVPGPSLAGTHFGPQRPWCARGGKRCAAETEVRKRPSDSLHGQMSPLCQLRHRRDYGGFRRRVKEK